MFTLSQGFMRDRILGPFLHQLAAKQQPTLQDVILAGGDSMAIRLADAYAAREAWLDILRRAVFASTSEEGWPGTQLPIAGGSCVVFTVRDVIYKFATKVKAALLYHSSPLRGTVLPDDLLVMTWCSWMPRLKFPAP